ncbi:Relaxase/mobilization nuclease domain protein [Acetatifactor muris]|uniref:Relaxase/mobilization nuclease domain protein n=1 Tax=Acetatifactor muris TaxID=879566 RepID=A0A2K4ZLL1_9FIRM|nr:Relaxase/mobilization nuclease domain protein [Acetatifactor muris]
MKSCRKWVKPLATFKHISSKNADYGAAEQYLTFEHDEFTMKPTLDKNGRLLPRDDYRIASLNCGGEDFAIACMRSNLKYGKNQKREDVKSHHYIISFDPRDAQDNGLTVDRAQQLGEQFCKEHFPGHQALVCTHPDGHNHSGNIHVHIVINSLRIAEVPLLPYMERPADTREGCKHRCTDAAMEYFKAEVMEMCHRENLYQIDLLNGSKNRVTEREYWAKRKGQAALDKENSTLAAKGEPPKPTKFETDKEKLRGAIRAALSSALSFEDFSGKLLQQGVTVKESRGRLSYLTPDRTKPITARKLGDDFDRAAVLEALTINAQNAARAAETPAPRQEYPRSIKDRLQRNKAAINAPKNDGVQRMVDIAAKRAEGKGKGYEKWATLHNLKQMAATMSIYEESGFSSLEELEAALAAASAELSSVHAELKAVESTLHEKRDLQKQLLAYIKTKPARDGLKAQKTEKARKNYREQHESDFMIAEAATRYFKAQGISKLPASKTLQAEIEQLMREKNSLYNEYREKRERTKELQTVKSNIEQILRREPERRKGRDNER